MRCKFVDVAVKILKTGSIRQSLDWVPNKDYAMLGAVFAECRFLKQISLMSDKCQEQDFNKLDADFEKDLAICAPETKINLQKYLKASERSQEEGDDKKKGESKNNTESSISRNPRTNAHIYPSIAQHLELTTSLLEFKIYYYRMAPRAWKLIGIALGQNKSIQTLVIQGCHLNQDNALSLLFTGSSGRKNMVAHE